MDAHNHVFSAVCRYLDSTAGNYAILIDGEWGSGKTFFWKNKLVPHLNLNHRKYLYVSLYGLTSIEEIDRRLLLAQYPVLKNGMMEAFAKFSKAGLESLNIKLPMDGLKADLSDSILCFDDLERISTTHVNCSDVLGYINSFVEHDGRKVILIGNEKEIEKTDDQYPKIKEKLIWRTYSYKPTIENVLSSMAEEFPENYAKFIRDSQKDLVSIIEASANPNLRGLKIAVNDFETIFNHLNRSSNGTVDRELQVGLFKLYLAILLEYKEDNRNKTSLARLFGADYFALLFRFGKGENKNELADYLEAFLQRYFDGNFGELQRFCSIYRYAIDGFLDSKVLDNELSEHAGPEDAETLARKRYFGEYWKLSNEEFASETEKVFREFEQFGVTSLAEMLKMASRLFFYSGQAIIPQSPQILQAALTSVVERSFATGKLEYSDVEREVPTGLYDAQDPEFGALRDLIIRTDKQVYEDGVKKVVNRIFDLMRTSISEGVKELDQKEYQYLANEPIFSHIDPDELSELLLKQSNDNAVTLYSFLRQRYKHHGLQRLASEKQNLERLRANMQQQHDQLKGKVAGSIRTSLVTILSEAVSNL